MTAKIEFFNHPEYDARREELQTAVDLYDGDHRIVSRPQYLWMHELEYSTAVATATETVGQRLRRIRTERSRYFNLMEPIVGNWTSFAFGNAAQLDAETEDLLGDEREDVDGYGTSLDDFIKDDIGVAYFRDGTAILAADAPATLGNSRAEQRDIGFRPYLEVLPALSVKDWQLADQRGRGRYTLLRQEYDLIAPREDLTSEPKKLTYCKRYRLTDGVCLVAIYLLDDGQWKPEGEVPLSDFTEIPISATFRNPSWVKEIAQQQLVLHNELSCYFNLLNSQCFQRTYVSGQMGERHQIAVSEYSVVVLPENTTVQTVEPADTTAHKDAVLGAIDRMYRIAFNRTRGLASDSKEAPSENTLREMNVELIKLLQQAVGNVESLLNQGLRHYALFKLGAEKGAKFTGKATLSRDIVAEDVEKQAQLFLTYRDEMRKILSWRKAHLKKVVHDMKYSTEETEEILSDIDKLKDEPQIDPTRAFKPFVRGNGQEDDQETSDAESADDGGEDGSPRGQSAPVPGA